VARFETEPYLLTVTAANRPHCAIVTVEWDDAGACIWSSARRAAGLVLMPADTDR
jgi:hypothetical protein